ncbi:hypothetical protein [uncultured Litoreibacter sp.]|uniref:hypothetical protein n=1 Tax=uncultured Litoreibacter sp. TaxID=1392394 RepID=UPI0026064C12|nr:hypothetical protein [uncultured Litoreibacter sp.]
MKKLLLVVPLAVAACSSAQNSKLDALVPDLYIATPQGAGLAPYSLAEYNARVADGQPGLVRRQEPWTRADARRKNSGSRDTIFTRKSKTTAAPVVATGPVLTGPKTAAEARALATATPTTYRLPDNTLVTVVLLPGGKIKETVQIGAKAG